MIIVRLLSPGPWLVATTKVYSGVGADIVMESISLTDPVLSVASGRLALYSGHLRRAQRCQRGYIANGGRSDAGWLRVPESVLFGTLRREFSVVATQWLSSFRSYGFMERGENILAATGSRRCSSSRMPVAWFTLRPLSSSGLVPDGAPTSFPVLQTAAVLYLTLYASLPCR
jgi:hypothetical protein